MRCLVQQGLDHRRVVHVRADLHRHRGEVGLPVRAAERCLVGDGGHVIPLGGNQLRDRLTEPQWCFACQQSRFRRYGQLLAAGLFSREHRGRGKPAHERTLQLGLSHGGRLGAAQRPDASGVVAGFPDGDPHRGKDRVAFLALLHRPAQGAPGVEPGHIGRKRSRHPTLLERGAMLNAQ